MAPHDTKPVTQPSTALFVLLNGLGFLLLIIGVVAIVAMNPINWFGIGLSFFAGLYSIVMAQVVRRREVSRQ